MSIMIDRDYALRLSPHVRNFKHTHNGFQFSCPLCGDSATNRSKARGFLYKNDDHLNYRCYNCDTPIFKLVDLLEQIDNRLAEAYKVDTFLEFKDAKPVRESAVKQPKFIQEIDDELVKVSSLPDYHIAKQYVLQRQIPSDKHYLLYYTRQFKQFAQRIDPSAFQKFNPQYHEDEARLVIPLISPHGTVSGYQGRSFDPASQVKYLTILPHPDNNRLFGLDRADVNRLVRVFEGPINALFINNAVATCGSRIDTTLPEVGISRDRSVVVYDNEPRKIETIVKIEKAIKNKFPVCIWPENVKENDVNAMVLAGRSPHQIEQMIDERTFTGLMAELELNRWRKI